MAASSNNSVPSSPPNAVSSNRLSGALQMATLASLTSPDDVTTAANDTLADGSNFTQEGVANQNPTTDHGAFITFRNTEQIILLSILLAAIVIANVIVLVALCIGQRRRSRINFFIGHLAVADLLVGLLNVLPELIVRIETHFFSQYDILCKLARSSMVFPLILSSNVLVALSIDRFYVIVYPMKIGNEGSRSRHMIMLAWLVTFIESIPFPFVFELNTEAGGEESQCLVKTLDSVWLTLYVIYASLISFALPFVLIVGCYIVIIITVTRKANARGLAVNGISDGADNLTNRHGGVALVTGGRSKLYKGRRSNPNIGAGQGPMGSSGAEIGLRRPGIRRCSGGQYDRTGSASTMIASSRGIIPKAKIKTIKMTVIIVAAFAICWTPYWGYTLLNFRKNSTGKDTIWVIIQNLAPLNSAADPLIYAFFTTNLWKEFRRLRIVQILCGKCCKMQPDNNPYNRGVVPKQSLNKMASLNVTTHTSRARGSSLSSVSGPSKKVSLEYTVSVANSRPRANSRTSTLALRQNPALSVIYSVDQQNSEIPVPTNHVQRISFLDQPPDA